MNYPRKPDTVCEEFTCNASVVCKTLMHLRWLLVGCHETLHHVSQRDTAQVIHAVHGLVAPICAYVKLQKFYSTSSSQQAQFKQL